MSNATRSRPHPVIQTSLTSESAKDGALVAHDPSSHKLEDLFVDIHSARAFGSQKGPKQNLASNFEDLILAVAEHASFWKEGADLFKHFGGFKVIGYPLQPSASAQQGLKEAESVNPKTEPSTVKVDPSVEAEFRSLKAQWLKQQKPTSKLRDIVLSMPYQQIIGMGKPVLPLLIAELRTNPHNWFWALEAITRENPIPEDANGDSQAILDAWLKWADEHGF